MSSPISKKHDADRRKAMIEYALPRLDEAVVRDTPDHVLKYYRVKSHMEAEKRQDIEQVAWLVKKAQETKKLDDLVAFTGDSDLRHQAFALLIRKRGQPKGQSERIQRANRAKFVRQTLNAIWPDLRRDRPDFPPYKGNAEFAVEIVNAYLADTLIEPPKDWPKYRRQPKR